MIIYELMSGKEGAMYSIMLFSNSDAAWAKFRQLENTDTLEVLYGKNYKIFIRERIVHDKFPEEE